jgi:hypothetical protein
LRKWVSLSNKPYTWSKVLGLALMRMMVILERNYLCTKVAMPKRENKINK